jgi:histidine triad (HIT) family protein
MVYDASNIFARIIRGEIPCNKIAENDYALAFPDLYPKAPVHVLVIPKGPYTDSSDFFKCASEIEIVAFYRLISEVVDKLDIRNEGYRLISNCGNNAGQEVPHYHVHVLAGRKLGPFLGRE